MDATCTIQDSIHVFSLVHNMCPGFWVHISRASGIFHIIGTFFLCIHAADILHEEGYPRDDLIDREPLIG